MPLLLGRVDLVIEGGAAHVTLARGDQDYGDGPRIPDGLVHFTERFVEVGALFIALRLEQGRDPNRKRQLRFGRPFLKGEPTCVKALVEGPNAHRVAVTQPGL